MENAKLATNQTDTVEKKPKNFLQDKEEEFALFCTFVRVGVLLWSGAILTLNYVTIPKMPQEKIDPTFIASVFTGTLATFGVQAAKRKDEK
jgi:hypothetical protein